jgi:hypothetical protein
VAIVQDLAEPIEPPAVHEHHAVHELDVVATAGIEHRGDLARSHPTGFSASTCLPASAALITRLFPHASRQRNVHGVDIRPALSNSS